MHGAAKHLCCTLIGTLTLIAGCSDSKSSVHVESHPVLPAFVAPDLAFPLQAPTPGGFGMVRAFPNLNFVRPMLLTHAPDGSDRIFVLEQAGTIRVFANSDELQASEVRTFLDIRSKVSSGGERGLLGMAFDPNFSSNGLFYLNYTRGNPFRTVIERYRVDAQDPNRADRESDLELLSIPQPFSNHNAGMIAFGPDRMLYISTGDGGSHDDPFDNAQSLSSLLGKMLRIDPRQPSGQLAYTIPSDNPYVGTGGNTREEIWASGLRNPWRFSFDENSGKLWCADVGQDRREEISLIEKGGNYGWRVFEGFVSWINPQNLPASAFDAPIFQYLRNLGQAVIGGYVYRGTEHTALRGTYLYGDNRSGRIWGLVYADGQIVENTQIAVISGLTSFGLDESKELYALADAGSIWRVVCLQPGGGSFPRKLSDTGLFSDLASLTPSPGVVPYEVNSPLWSDRARKRRWIAVPAANSVNFSAAGNWQFPTGTVLVKHFDLPTELDGVHGLRRLETRVLIHEHSGWAGYTYKWNREQNDALLISERVDEEFLVHGESRRSGPAPTDHDAEDSEGKSRFQTWTYPSRPDCLSCHTSRRGFVLGVRTLQLNRLADGDQLAEWRGMGLFSSDIGASSQYESMPTPRDIRADLDLRARAYLAANCAQCHLPGGSAATAIDMRFATPLDQTGMLNVAPQAGNLGLADAAIIRSGDHQASVLWQRMRTLEGFRMPPLATHLVDPAGVSLIAQWIDSLQ